MATIVHCRQNLPSDIGRYLFLAGPIRNAPEWQTSAIWSFRDEPDIVVASPRDRSGDTFPKDPFWVGKSRTKWEISALERAARNGVILFWLPRQESYVHREHPYGRDTRREIGTYLLGMKRFVPEVNIVLGYQKEFSGIEQILDSMDSYNIKVPTFQTLDETCAAALELIRQ